MIFKGLNPKSSKESHLNQAFVESVDDLKDSSDENREKI